MKMLQSLIAAIALAVVATPVKAQECVQATSEVNVLAGDTLYPGQEIHPGDQLHSSSGVFHLEFTNEGRLELHKVTSYGEIVKWRTWASGGTLAEMEEDGNFVLYNNDGRKIWQSYTKGNDDSRLIMQNDGNLVIYTPSGQPIWASNTNE